MAAMMKKVGKDSIKRDFPVGYTYQQNIGGAVRRGPAGISRAL